MMADDSKICQCKNGKKKRCFLPDCIDAGGGCISVCSEDDLNSIEKYSVH